MIGYQLVNASHVLQLLQFMPVDYNLIKRVITSFNNLHYDKDTGILHSLPASRVHELRGRSNLIGLSESDSIALLTLAASIANEFSVLQMLLDDYIEVKETRKKGQRTYKHFHEYLVSVLTNETKTNALQTKVRYYIILYYITVHN